MKQIVATINGAVEGFAPIDREQKTFDLCLRLGESLISLPLSREAMKELSPKWGQILFIDLCIPSDADAPTS